MHPLKSYLKSRDITAEAFAALVDSTSSYLSQMVCGRRRPSVEMARKIEAATGGEVQAADCLLWDPLRDEDLAVPVPALPATGTEGAT